MSILEKLKEPLISQSVKHDLADRYGFDSDEDYAEWEINKMTNVEIIKTLEENRPKLSTEAQADLHKQLITTQTVRSCLNCDEWQNNACMKYAVTPPGEVIVYGCPEWIAAIPF